MADKKSDTPRTDALKFIIGNKLAVVNYTDAQEIERDLNQLRAGIKHLQKMSASEMRLQMGEMTASEISLVRAITNALLAMPNERS